MHCSIQCALAATDAALASHFFFQMQICNPVAQDEIAQHHILKN
jgi:hypothetical protein